LYWFFRGVFIIISSC